MAKAADTILLGNHGEIAAGEDIPDSYVDTLGEEHKTDFKRLEELGLVEKSKPKASSHSKSKSSKS